MSIETVYEALAAVVVAVPIAVVVGVGLLLTIGGIIGSTRCLLSALTNGSEPATQPAEAPSTHGRARLA